jgi:2-polyprenyl-3-methyl-5-hydroxy-6-metoxy-1,4-benzoquinol methylase
MNNLQNVFCKIFSNNSWGGRESVSGPGSSLSSAEQIIPEISNILLKLNVSSMLDMPCGDFNWMQYVDLKNIKYTGVDIVPDIVNNNNRRYSSTNITFKTMDATVDDIGYYDLIFCRDMLVHLSYKEIFCVLKNVKFGGSKYLMFTTFDIQVENKDTVTPKWRPLNFQLAPFNFPHPVATIKEKPKGKLLALYAIESINL